MRRATAAWLAMVAALFALVTPNVFLGAQFQRYVLWAFPGLLALTAAGLGHATTWAIRDPRASGPPSGRWPSCGSALGALATLRFASLYGEFAGDVYRRDVATAHWIRRNLPPGTAMANLATSVEYLTGHRSLNLHGVTTPDFFGGHAAEREADTFEGLRRLAPAVAPALPHHHRLHAGPLPHHARAGQRAAPLPLRQLRRRDRDLPDELRPARRGKDPALAATAGVIGTRARRSAQRL